MREDGVWDAIRRLIIGTVSDHTIAFLAVACLGHLIIAATELVLGHQIEALDVAIVVVDASALGQLVVRINLDTLRMIKRAAKDQ